MSLVDNPESAGVPVPPQHSRGAVRESVGYSPFPIVGIGASAGGFEAFQQLLAQLPAETGMAFVFVQHLDPRHESKLADLLTKTSKISVVEATHGLAVRPDHVYTISPNTNLAINQGRFSVTPRPEERRPHLAIDFFFRSLAEEQKGRAIGVVLSGTGADGTQGLCEIKAVGGITFVQDNQSARHSGMPSSAYQSGCADFVLPPDEIARRLIEVGRHPYVTAMAKLHEGEDYAEAQYENILARVREIKGVDFSQYRDTTIKRRIMRRMAVHQESSLESYIERLAGDPKEVEALYDDLLINVTSFFRDPELFDALKERVFPEILKGRRGITPVRVWVPGCSTGQEAYSISMAFMEFVDDKPVRTAIQIFATDLADPTVLERARAGVYPESIEGEVTPERLRRFFRKEDHVYRIDKAVRESCVFARQNVAHDPPFSHVDLISCRNVLIYLGTPLQRRVLPIFHYALNIPGFLILGSSETVGENADLFQLVDRSNKIYSKSARPAHLPLQFAAGDYRAETGLAPRRSSPPGPGPADFQREADRILLSRYAPPGVLINQNLDILQFRGRTSPYLESPPGEPTTNLLKMAREGLFLELRSAIGEAQRLNQPVRRERVIMRSDGGAREVSLEVVPVRAGGSGGPCFLVLFQDSEESGTAVKGGPRTVSDEPREAAPQIESANERAIIQLQKELAATKEYLQSLIEQQDAMNEELRSANEEILSSNEELQSTNEELETAKEELQSGNEELTTVNEQLQVRNAELSQTTNDLMNLLSSTAIPVVMVGSDLCVRRFTDAAKKAMNLLPADVGRPIGDLKTKLDVPDLEALLAEVIDQVQIRTREVRDREGRWHLLRIHPYRTTDNRIDGAVAVFVDINEVRSAQEALQQSLAQIHSDAEELTRFNNVAVGRELRMIELKKEVNELCQRLGESPKYPLDFEEEDKDSDE
jgi:two-component system CheB/CheR fusion protein